MSTAIRRTIDREGSPGLHSRLLFRGGLIVLAVLWAFIAAGLAAGAGFGVEVRGPATGSGVEIVAIDPGTPAAASGLKPGDVILSVEGAPLTNADQFRQMAQAVPAGATVRLRVSRQGWEREVALQSQLPRAAFGIAVADPVRGSGAAIKSIETGSAAADAKLEAGDRLLRIDGKSPANAAEARRMLEDAATRARVLALAVERDGWTREVTLTLRPSGAAKPVVTTTMIDSAARDAVAPLGAAQPGASLGATMDEGNRLYNARDWRGAEAAYQRAQDMVPDDATVLARLCHARLMQERFAAAVETCRRAVQLDPKEPRTFQNLGYSLARLGRHADALSAYATAIELAPEWTAPQEGSAAAYIAMSNWARAEASYRRVVALEPGNATAWRMVGDAAGEQGKTADAIGAYQKSLECGGKTAETYRNLGWYLYRASRYAEAEAALQDAQRLNPRDASALVSLGLALEKLGRRDEAMRAWQRASDVDPAGPSGGAARQNLAAFAATDAQSPPAAPRPVRAADLPMSPATQDEPVARAPMRSADVSRPAVLPPAAPTVAAPRASVATGPGERMLARVAIGDFQVKAANAGQYVGDGLREMLLTALHNSGRFIVVERLDLKGLAAEQALSRSRLARPGESIPEGQMEVADIMVYGAVTEFEPEVRGGGLSLGMGNVPLNLGMQGKSAHMAIDVRVVDVASGRVLATNRLSGEARSTQLTVGTTISARGTSFPATLGGFQNTPMEQAIRDCIDKATTYVATTTPAAYFRHR